MTSSIVEGLKRRKRGPTRETAEVCPDEPSLDDPAVGRPISHGQIVSLWKEWRETHSTEFSLEQLLRGSGVYVPPPQESAPSDEFKALMARLRKEEEQRVYERMINFPQPLMTVPRRLPAASSMAHAFTEVNRPIRDTDLGDDDVTYSDVHRQLMLILNFVVSIVGVAATLWILARWWPTPSRLFLAMGGSVLVGIAEVAVYSGYVWHLGEAKKKDKKLQEIRDIVQTWVIGNDEDEGNSKKSNAVHNSRDLTDNSLRRRKNLHI